jgi:hypothetical protein
MTCFVAFATPLSAHAMIISFDAISRHDTPFRHYAALRFAMPLIA